MKNYTENISQTIWYGFLIWKIQNSEDAVVIVYIVWLLFLFLFCYYSFVKHDYHCMSGFYVLQVIRWNLSKDSFTKEEKTA